MAKSGVEGEALKEAIAINKSLTALGDVIEALTKRQKNVPYDSPPQPRICGYT